MKNSSVQKVLEDLLEGSARLLLDRISQGEATAAEIGQAINLLRNNGVSLELESSDAMNGLADSLKAFDKEMREDSFH